MTNSENVNLLQKSLSLTLHRVRDYYVFISHITNLCGSLSYILVNLVSK